MTMRLKTVRLVGMLALVLFMVPLAANAQPSTKVSRIGWLLAGSPPTDLNRREAGGVAVFRQGLHDLGYVEGQHFVMEYRYTEGNLERLPDLAAELVGLPVDLIMTGTTPETQAAQHATKTIPIVMVGISNPVGNGLVASLARPGGNITGLAILAPELVGKQLEFLKEILPTVSRVAVLWNPANPAHALTVRAADVAAQALGVHLHRVEARGPDAFDSAFAAMTRAHAGALLVLGDPMFVQHRRRLAELAATSRLPTMHQIQCRAFAEAGGLLCYGASLLDSWRRAAAYVDKILKGVKPAELPVEQPMTFELVINLKTADALGLKIPPTLLFQADEIIR
jgi:putative tryptophan/tyrosine transport system substrate-binding protein